MPHTASQITPRADRAAPPPDGVAAPPPADDQTARWTGWMIALVGGWLGAALFFAAVVTRAAFAVLPTRAEAGLLVGRTLPVLLILGALAGALLVAAARTVLDRSRASRTVAVAGGVAGVACLVAQFVVGRAIERLRADIGPSLDALAPLDPRRAEFGRLHGASVALLGVAMLAAAAALAVAVHRLRGST